MEMLRGLYRLNTVDSFCRCSMSISSGQIPDIWPMFSASLKRASITFEGISLHIGLIINHLVCALEQYWASVCHCHVVPTFLCLSV